MNALAQTVRLRAYNYNNQVTTKASIYRIQQMLYSIACRYSRKRYIKRYFAEGLDNEKGNYLELKFYRRKKTDGQLPEQIIWINYSPSQ